MTSLRIPALLATAGLVSLLSGCVVAPIGPRPYAVYPAGAVYVEPAPIVVVPAYGYRGYYGHRGYRQWR